MRKLTFLLLLPSALLAQREPVLKQIDLPHPYYYREMYLPQLTSGPSWVTWSPDSKEIIYSMAGSLWRQKIDSNEAVQLTDGPGYDYQPDWSHDGKYVVYTKYHQDAMELWLLDLASGKTSHLTKDSGVNVEPRWSPDDKRIVFVSTERTNHFHLWLLEMDGGAPKSVCGNPRRPNCTQPSEASPLRQLTKENVSTLPRYYYSKFDHEISPAWSPDGKDIVFVSNHGHIHGTGGIWRATVPDSGMIDTNTNAKEIHYEETNWKARPEFSPDGKKIAYASYLGRQWHQLWLMPSQGGDVFPLTYGEYDNINPRWSPDGKLVASVSNESGDLALKINGLGVNQDVARPVSQGNNWQDFCPRPTIGSRTIAPVRITTNDLMPSSWLASDDSRFAGRDSELHYFDYPPLENALCMKVRATPGEHKVLLTHGLEVVPTVLTVDLRSTRGSIDSPPVPLQPLGFTQDDSVWKSGDLHIHSSYGGTYRAGHASLGQQLEAEDVSVGFDLIVNKEQRFPAIGYGIDLLDHRLGSTNPGRQKIISVGQEFHTSYWGHLGLLNIKHLIIPGYAGYPNTAAASLVPMDADVADMAHAQNKDALVGWVHPFDVLPDPYKDAKLTNELPIDVALGKIDYYEVVGFSDHKASAAIWYRLLNLGFHLPAGAGTDAMTNFASLRGPVGLNRVYVRMHEEKTRVPRLGRRGDLARDDKSKVSARDDNPKAKPLDLDLWLKNLKAGKTFATNGPLLRFSLGGQPIGGEVKLPKAAYVPFHASIRSIVPFDQYGIVCNGKDSLEVRVYHSEMNVKETRVKDSQGHEAFTSVEFEGEAPITESGWCVLRAYSDHAEEPIMDIYPYGTTSPIYVTVAGENVRSPEDAKFFSKWIERVREDASVHPDYNTPKEREHVLKVLDEAAGVYSRMQEAGGGR